VVGRAVVVLLVLARVAAADPSGQLRDANAAATAATGARSPLSSIR